MSRSTGFSDDLAKTKRAEKRAAPDYEREAIAWARACDRTGIRPIRQTPRPPLPESRRTR